MAEPNHVLCWLRVQGIGARLERKTGRTQARVFFFPLLCGAEVGLPPSRSAPRLLLVLIHLQRFRTLTPEKAKQTEELARLARLVRLKQLANILIYTFYGSHLYIVIHIAMAVHLSQKPSTAKVKMCAIIVVELTDVAPQSGVLACSVTSRVVQRSCTSPALGQATVCI